MPINSLQSPNQTQLDSQKAKQNESTESVLDTMFSRLTTQSFNAPNKTTKRDALPGAEKEFCSSENGQKYASDVINPTTKLNNSPGTASIKATGPALAAARDVSEIEKQKVSSIGNNVNFKKPATEPQDPRVVDLLNNTIEYVNALPAIEGSALHMFKLAAKNLDSLFNPKANPDTKNWESAKKRYVIAITDYVNGQFQKGSATVKASSVEEILNEQNGSFLHLLTTLILRNYIPLNISIMRGLCKVILDVVPTQEAPIVSVEDTAKDVPTYPMGTMEAWPVQEKRDSGK